VISMDQRRGAALVPLCISLWSVRLTGQEKHVAVALDPSGFLLMPFSENEPDRLSPSALWVADICPRTLCLLPGRASSLNVESEARLQS